MTKQEIEKAIENGKSVWCLYQSHIEEHEVDDIKAHNKEILEEQREKTFILYSLLYQELEKQDIENVASRIDFMTSENYADICELYKTAKNLKQHDRELVKEVCEKVREYLRTQVIYCGGRATELDIMIASAVNQVLEDVKQFLDQIQKLEGEDE